MYSSTTTLGTSPSANAPLQGSSDAQAEHPSNTSHASVSDQAVQRASGLSCKNQLADMLFLSRVGLGEVVKVRRPKSTDTKAAKAQTSTPASGYCANDVAYKSGIPLPKGTINNRMGQRYPANPAMPTTLQATALTLACTQWLGDFVTARPMPAATVTNSPEIGQLKALLSRHYQPSYNNLVAALKLELTNQHDLRYAGKYIATPGNIAPSVISILRNKHQPGTLIRDKFDRYLCEGSIQLAYESKRDPQLKKLKELLGGSPSEQNLANALQMTLITEDALSYVQNTLSSSAWKATVQRFKANQHDSAYIEKLEAYVEEGTCNANERAIARSQSKAASLESVTEIATANTTLAKFPAIYTWTSNRIGPTTPTASTAELRIVPNVTRKTLKALPVGRSMVQPDSSGCGNYHLLFSKAEVGEFMQNRIPLAKLVNYALRMTCDQEQTVTAHINHVAEIDGYIQLTFKDQPVASEDLKLCEFVHRSDLWRYTEQEQIVN